MGGQASDRAALVARLEESALQAEISSRTLPQEGSFSGMVGRWARAMRDAIAALVAPPEAADATIAKLEQAVVQMARENRSLEKRLNAPDCRAAVRAAVEAGWDDGVRFASEVLRSQVYPKTEARQACVERVLAVIDASAKMAETDEVR